MPVSARVPAHHSAYVVAVDSPYFAVTDGEGEFVIPAVPAGRYRYHAWRAGSSELSGDWSVGATDGVLTIEWPK